MMRIVTGSEIYKKHFKNTIVTIGNFDGVHLGHVELFNRLKQKSRDHCLPSLVVTFEPHPLKILAPESAPSRITTFDQKAALIAESDVDFLVVIPFSLEISKLSADSFVREILCESLGMAHIIIGHDYAFGRGREGDFNTLERLGTELKFTVEDLEPVGKWNLIFSSSLVRSCITAGDMSAATGILGRYYMISGKVVHGREIGQTLGFPTANITTTNEMIPPDGVYAVIVVLAGRLLQGACNIGINPTFEGRTRTIEVFLLDFSGQIYGEEILIYFLQKLRGIKKFGNATELAGAITNDVEATRCILADVQDEFIRPRMIGNL